jgi:hypothetical protein
MAEYIHGGPQWRMIEGGLDADYFCRLYYPALLRGVQTGWRWELVGPLAAMDRPIVVDNGAGRSYEDAVEAIMESYRRRVQP